MTTLYAQVPLCGASEGVKSNTTLCRPYTSITQSALSTWKALEPPRNRGRLAFPEIFSGEWKSIFLFFRKRGQPCGVYRRFRRFPAGNFCSNWLSSRNLWSNGSLLISGKFPWKFLTIYPRFETFGLFSWMEIARELFQFQSYNVRTYDVNYLAVFSSHALRSTL